MTDDDSDSIVELLADDYAQMILEHTMDEPLSADQLSDICETSPQTVYRRLEGLVEHDLVDEELEPGEDGHHYRVYRATLDRAVVDLTADGLEVTVSRRDRMADRFTEFVSEVSDR